MKQFTVTKNMKTIKSLRQFKIEHVSLLNFTPLSFLIELYNFNKYFFNKQTPFHHGSHITVSRHDSTLNEAIPREYLQFFIKIKIFRRTKLRSDTHCIN